MRGVVAQAGVQGPGWIAASLGVRDYLRLLKLGVGLLMVFTAATAAVVANPGAWREVGLLVAAGAMACAGSGALNHYLELDLDALMPRTSRRPLPAGRIAPGQALALGLGLLGLGLVLSLGLNPLTSLFILSGALVYVVIYTWWLKRRSPWNIVLGGASGSLGVLAGWSAATGGISPTAVAMALVVFLWTPPHFWSFAMAHREEYARAGVPMLPVLVGHRATARWIALHVLLLVAVSLVGLGGVLGSLYLATAASAGLGLLGLVAWLNLSPGPGRGRAVFRASNIYLALLFVAMMADALV